MISALEFHNVILNLKHEQDVLHPMFYVFFFFFFNVHSRVTVKKG